jgi:plasmid stabilization system protein ParE
LRVEPDAEEELTEAAEWYEARSAGLGVELVAVVDGAFEAIVAAPLAHPLWRPGRPYRAKVLKQFPYVIFFRCEDDDVVVIAIALARRRPGYWVGRTPG